MVITHNISAINTRSYLKINQNSLQKNLEKLSSGYKINRAGDDAAGLAISQHMRAIIGGTKQAKQNVLDGISLVQTAEGAMQEIHSMLNRAYELGVASSNAIYSSTEREAMESELDQLKAEIQRITKTTNFNGIYLLRGKEKISNNSEDVYIDKTTGLPNWVVCGQAIADGHLTEEYTTTEQYTATDDTKKTAQILHAAGTLDFSGLTSANKKDLIGKGFYTTCFTCSNHYSIRFTDSKTSDFEQSGSHLIYNIGIADVTTADELIQAIIDGTNNGHPNQHYTKLVADPNHAGKLIVYDDRSKADTIPVNDLKQWDSWEYREFGISPDRYPNYGKFGLGVAVSASQSQNQNSESQGDIQLQIGPFSNDVLKVILPDTTMTALGIDNISIISQDLAQDSLEKLKNVIDYLSVERGRMGAYQNRLEFTDNSLSIMHENLQAAESRIRDTDMAEEMMQYTKNNILQQSAISMLAQANMVPQKVISLLTA